MALSKESIDERIWYGGFLAGVSDLVIQSAEVQKTPRTISFTQVGSAKTSSMYWGGFRCSIHVL